VRADQGRKLDGKGGDEGAGRHLHRQLGEESHVCAGSIAPADRDRVAGGDGDQNAKLYQAGLEAERLAAIGETTAAPVALDQEHPPGAAAAVRMWSRWVEEQQHSADSKGWRVADRNLQKIYSLTMNLLQVTASSASPSSSRSTRAVLIDDCVELIATAATEKGVMVVADIDPHHPAIPLDPDGMHQGADEPAQQRARCRRAEAGADPRHLLLRQRGQSGVLEVVDNAWASRRR